MVYLNGRRINTSPAKAVALSHLDHCIATTPFEGDIHLSHRDLLPRAGAIFCPQRRDCLLRSFAVRVYALAFQLPSDCVSYPAQSSYIIAQENSRICIQTMRVHFSVLGTQDVVGADLCVMAKPVQFGHQTCIPPTFHTGHQFWEARQISRHQHAQKLLVLNSHFCCSACCSQTAVSAPCTSNTAETCSLVTESSPRDSSDATVAADIREASVVRGDQRRKCRMSSDTQDVIVQTQNCACSVANCHDHG